MHKVAPACFKAWGGRSHTDQQRKQESYSNEVPHDACVILSSLECNLSWGKGEVDGEQELVTDDVVAKKHVWSVAA